MEVIIFIVLAIFKPFFLLIGLCRCKSIQKNKKINKNSMDICHQCIDKNTKRLQTGDELIWASSKNYTDMWTRDVFFTIFQHSKGSVVRVVQTLAKYQREDGLIPLYIGQGNACLKLFCNQKPSGRVFAYYNDAKSGDEPTDSCFQFIIMAFECQLNVELRDHIVKAWEYGQRNRNNKLVHEFGLGTWQDTIKHHGNVLYTNVLFYQATQYLYPRLSETIKNSIIKHLWNGFFFKASTSNDSFDQVGNALAILYNIAPKPAKILEIREQYFQEQWPPPNKKIDLRKQTSRPGFEWYEIYLPCYLIGNAKYHNGWCWSWVDLLFLKISHGSIAKWSDKIQEYGSMYEVYDQHGSPIDVLLYQSQPDFSEACGLYLNIIEENNNIELAL